MTDILVDNNKLKVQNGDFVTVNRLEKVKQHIVVALNTLYGEWILDKSKGIDYAFGMRNTHFLDHAVRNQILGVDKVQSLDNFKMFFDKENLSVNIIADVYTDYGVFNLNMIPKYEI